MAYKIRKYSSLEEALSYVIEQLGDDAIEKATDMSSSYIRKCSDADTNQRLPFQQHPLSDSHNQNHIHRIWLLPRINSRLEK